MSVNTPFSEKVLKRVVKDAGSGCWIWTGGVGCKGYAQWSTHNGTCRVGRAMLIETKGYPPFPKAEACHSCGNRRCVNPDHLRWGDRSENNKDKAAKRRNNTQTNLLMNRGSRNGKAKLTEDLVREMRAKYATGEHYVRAIAREFGIHYLWCGKILAGKAWRHIQ